MEYRDYYETLGVPRTATQDEIKQAYRKLARKYHPDVSKERDAESRFKQVNEANEVLRDPEKRAAYDRMGSNWKAGQDFQPPPGWDEGFEFRGGAPGGGGGFQRGFGGGGEEDFDASDFFEQLFGRGRGGMGGTGGMGGMGRGAGARASSSMQGEDSHAKVHVALEDAYRGAERSIVLRAPAVGDDGRVHLEERRLDVHIPKGIRSGQQLRLAGQGQPGHGGAAAGDLYLEIDFEPNDRYRLDGAGGADVYTDVRIAPWEAALGAPVEVTLPDGVTLQMSVPPNSQPGRKLRLKGRGLPAAKASGTPGDFYVVLQVALPPADNPRAKEAWETLAKAFPGYDPRR